MSGSIDKNDSPIDLESALERTGGDKEFLHELLDLYISEFGPHFQKIKDALKEADLNSIQELAHSLKGSSANLSLLTLQDISYTLENAGRDQDLDAVRENIPLLESEFQRLKVFLKKTD
ncbi:Hpt domain-containing protein [Acidobacteriota bacterium]